jgi:hypothetical protein
MHVRAEAFVLLIPMLMTQMLQYSLMTDMNDLEQSTVISECLMMKIGWPGWRLGRS